MKNKTDIAKIVESIIKKYGKSRICQSHDTSMTVSMDEPHLSDLEMDEMIGKIEAAVPGGVTVEEEEGGLISISWE
jgi:hypothetical protein